MKRHFIEIPEFEIIVTDMSNDDKYDYCIYRKDNNNVLASRKPTGEIEFTTPGEPIIASSDKGNRLLTKKYAFELFEKLIKRRVTIIDEILY